MGSLSRTLKQLCMHSDCQLQCEQSFFSESAPELGILTGPGGGRKSMNPAVRQTWTQILTLTVFLVMYNSIYFLRLRAS